MFFFFKYASESILGRFFAALYPSPAIFALTLVVMPQPRRHLSLLLTQPQALWAQSVGGGEDGGWGCARLPHQARRPITCWQKELANRFYNGTLRTVTQDHKPLSSAAASTVECHRCLKCACDVMCCECATTYDTQQRNAVFERNRKFTNSYVIQEILQADRK